MPLKDVALACLVMVIWGFNFVAIHFGLEGVPPLVFAALRFCVVLLALPFVARPQAPLRRVLLVGVFLSLGQFALLYTSMAVGMPPGLASLVLQAQALFTTVLAVALLREAPGMVRLVGLGLGMAGLAVVAVGRGSATAIGMILCLMAALSWATGNVLVRYLRIPGGLGVTVWSAIVVPIPLFVLAAIVDGPEDVVEALTHLTPAAWLSTLYTAVLASLVGYGIWNGLLARHPASSVAPFTLLVPVVGIAAAWFILNERPTPMEWLGGALLLGGVATVTLGPRAVARLRTTPGP